MSRIVQLANFVTPSSGGLRAALEHLATGYAAAGHEVVRITPGPRDAVAELPWGRQLSVRAPELPGTGYRVLHDPRRVLRVLDALAPDRVEVHDRTTLRAVGVWARRSGVPSLVVSHERLDQWLPQWLPARLPLDRLADATNTALAERFDQVVCTRAWAEREFTRLGVPNLRRVPLGVELDRFTPAPPRPDDGTVRLVLAGRLSKEKRPDLAVAAVPELQLRGHRVCLRVAGDGPLRRRLEGQAAGLPVDFLGFIRDRSALAHELASADIALAPGPVETFGLAALEAMASGTPVIANVHSALPEVLGDAGLSAAPEHRNVRRTVRCCARSFGRTREVRPSGA